MRKNPEITAMTKQAFIDAFCLLSQRKPTEKITVRELSERAGYNRCTFYQYFSDVYAVLETIENRVAAEVKENFRVAIKPEDFGKTFLNAFTRIHREQAPYFDLLLRPANRARFSEKLIAEVGPILAARFHLPPEDERSGLLTELYLSTALAAVARWINSGRKLPLPEFSALLRDVLSSGVLPAMRKQTKNKLP